MAGARGCWQGAVGTAAYTIHRHAACSGTVVTAGAGHTSQQWRQQRGRGRQQATDIRSGSGLAGPAFVHISGATGASSADRGHGLSFAALPMVCLKRVAMVTAGSSACATVAQLSCIWLLLVWGVTTPMHQAGA